MNMRRVWQGGSVLLIRRHPDPIGDAPRAEEPNHLPAAPVGPPSSATPEGRLGLPYGSSWLMGTTTGMT